jgi:hypothetical protein
MWLKGETDEAVDVIPEEDKNKGCILAPSVDQTLTERVFWKEIRSWKSRLAEVL